ncbi:MAG: site-specific DNA-methyltransferase [Kiritimatiellae bacterium]|nr:site-specific DNA-methyltransferase [Kiritimatiellia bacterium]
MKSEKYDDLSREDLIRLLARREKEPRRRFGLVWEQDDLEREAALNADFVALEQDGALSCGGAPYRNLLIEGDNFDALRYLRMTHAGRVKCIYIDPPYNTGNRDFVYNDRFLDKDDAFRHSKWLEFMYRRLALARDLLRDDGAIFVHIGEEEMAHLTCLMDQLFPGMKVGTFVWKTRSGANDSKNYFFSQDHEYVLCYAGPGFSFEGDMKDTSAYKNPDNDPRGPWINDNLVTNKSLVERPNAYYPVQNPNTGVWYACDPDNTWRFASETKLKVGQKIRTVTMEQLIEAKKILWPKDPATVSYGSMEELFAAIDAGTAPRNLRRDIPDLEYWIGKTIGFGKPRYKRHLSEVRRSEKPLSSWVIPNAAKKDELMAQVNDTAESLRSGYTSDGTSLVQDMLNNKDFPYPKPLSLVQALLAQATGPDDLVVDFFAGSGTTGHAVLALNAEDGGDRRFILVSCTEATAAEPDKNVCRDITQRRLAAAVNGYTVHTKKGFKPVEGLGGGFAYLRARRVGIGELGALSADPVWLAVALFHFGMIPANAVAGEAWYAAVTDDACVAYLPRVDGESVRMLLEVMDKSDAPATVYTHQVSALRQRLGRPEAEILPVPEMIVKRFGLEVTP